jgi:hypothetical protein
VPIINTPLTLNPFPTVTPGRQVSGLLPTVVGVPLSGGVNANPASDLLPNQLTPTSDLRQCPPNARIDLDPQPAIARDINAAVIRYLSAGGNPQALQDALRSDWGVLGINGYVRADFDLTGEGVAETIVSYLAPDGGGTLMIGACVSGRVELVYDALLGGEPPQIVWTSDMTFDGAPDLLFASRVCTDEGDDTCGYRTQLITWRAALGRFVNLLGEPIASNQVPTVEDVDQDRVNELVVRLDDQGDAESGPRRTGIAVYDWNGGSYVRALVQLDPPRFRIQVVQQADAAFAAEAYDEALALYELALTSPDLRNWQADDAQFLQTYVTYRVMLVYSYLEDEQRIELSQQLQQQFPEAASAPVYVQMTLAFWNALQVTNNLRSACAEVQTIIAARPEALAAINRYGSESPTYSAEALCPF